LLAIAIWFLIKITLSSGVGGGGGGLFEKPPPRAIPVRER
jgi:hypothetical protein